MVSMLEKLKTDKNYQKIVLIYILLLISNIILLAGLLNYYSNFGVNVEIETIDHIMTIIATIIILGFITTKLPVLRRREDSLLYEIGYLIIIAVVGVMDTYFNGEVGIPLSFSPYLQMFKILSVILIFVLLATKLKSFRGIIRGEFTPKNLLVCLVIFTILGIFASNYHIMVDGTPANVRCCVTLIGGLFGGPLVGVPLGIISGAYRFTLGGTTALPCAITTLLSGIIGSLIHQWNGKKFPKTIPAIILMGLLIGFEMMMIVLLTPPNISFPFIKSIYPIMLFASLIGIILFSMAIKQERLKIEKPHSPEKQKINELETKLEGHNEKIEELKNEIKRLEEKLSHSLKDDE